MKASMNILEVNHIKKYYRKSRAVDDVTFQVKKGEIFGLLGENGAGKSTMLSIISTLVKPDSGTILYEGKDIMKDPKVIQKKLGYVPQEIALYTMLSGMDNLKFFCDMYHINKKDQDESINKVLDIIGLDKGVLKNKVETYSGGMKRRLNIGVALLHRPDVVILDEPTVGIDVQSRNQILDSMIVLAKEGTTIIYVGHYMEEIEKISDTICVMEKGKVVLLGEKDSLLNGKSKLTLEELYLNTVSKIIQ
ncbi:ABC transporter ATP-binding protein [Anaeromicropila herbilytica]|uniref:ABC transporter ATP-binding protein n=1 Tax=Anaeromicropila herbilytica TaxID=2785025 RepID=A0A7R7EGF7_9FIRM|nr:ABC transporter ATP-binding protein [Anaeromicropila herbilytica]BCN28750.1 ABC transporter ATP-binding protein [Anaeromicropila herbilytica]